MREATLKFKDNPVAEKSQGFFHSTRRGFFFWEADKWKSNLENVIININLWM